MSFEFEEEVSQNFSVTKKTGMVPMLMRMRLAKNEQQANSILIILVITLFIITVFLLPAKNKEVKIELDPSIDPETYLPYGVTPPT